jgi:hypothetical protein
MCNSMNLHKVATVTISREAGSEFRWVMIALTHADGTVTRIAAHGTDNAEVEFVDVTGDFEEPEDDEDEPREDDEMFHIVCDDTGYRADMTNAGRGHLLGG